MNVDDNHFPFSIADDLLDALDVDFHLVDEAVLYCYHAVEFWHFCAVES